MTHQVQFGLNWRKCILVPSRSGPKYPSAYNGDHRHQLNPAPWIRHWYLSCFKYCHISVLTVTRHSRYVRITNTKRTLLQQNYDLRPMSHWKVFFRKWPKENFLKANFPVWHVLFRNFSFKSPFHAFSKEKTFQCDMGLKFSFALACDIHYSGFIPAPPLLWVSHLRTAV